MNAGAPMPPIAPVPLNRKHRLSVRPLGAVRQRAKNLKIASTKLGAPPKPE